ncbi:unnamed protein product [Ectocarpus sp. 12 AP-2014]
MAFIILVTISSSLVCAMSVVHTVTRTGHVGPMYLTDSVNLPGSRFVSPVLGMWTAMITVLVGALLCFHVYLLAKGQTTNEYLRGEKRRGNVPHRSFGPNCRELWCGTQPASMLADMSEFSTGHTVHGGVSYTANAYTELQEIIRPQGGDLV